MNQIETVANRPPRHFPSSPVATGVAEHVAPSPGKQPLFPSPPCALPLGRAVWAAPIDRLVFVDVLRGLAILGVISVHVRYAFPDLPGVVRFFGGLGRYGVDLFFVVSAFTLFRSNQNFSLKSFLVRRWLRIAPVYYLGIVLYTAIPRLLSPDSGPGLGAIVANLFFLNAWIPGGGNAVVPGGWSISTEVAFYSLLPVAMVFVTSLRRAIIAFVVTLIASELLLRGVSASLAARFSANELSEFKAYCPLGHLATFCLGLVLYHLLPRLRVLLPETRHRAIALGLMIAGIVLLPLLHALDLSGILPRSVAAGGPAFLFSAGVALGLRSSRSRLVAALQWLGVVSYGVYVIHFHVLDFVERLVVGTMPIGAPGMVLFLSTLVLASVLSAAGAYLVHRTIELPALRLARPKRSSTVMA